MKQDHTVAKIWFAFVQLYSRRTRCHTISIRLHFRQGNKVRLCVAAVWAAQHFSPTFEKTWHQLYLQTKSFGTCWKHETYRHSQFKACVACCESVCSV